VILPVNASHSLPGQDITPPDISSSPIFLNGFSIFCTPSAGVPSSWKPDRTVEKYYEFWDDTAYDPGSVMPGGPGLCIARSMAALARETLHGR